jgi:phage terminase large subunit-like protein
MTDQSDIDKKIYELKLKKLDQLKAEIELQQGLPHIYGWPWYRWAWEIYNSKNREIFLTSANQVSKSSTAIRKNIMLATSKDKWKEFWPGLRPGYVPSLFWYIMPTTGTCTTEVENKWMKEFLPRGDYKNSDQYGWEAEYFKGEIWAINFRTDIQIQFKSYEMKIKNLQSSSVYHMTCDEEVPVDYLAEFKSRLNATDGYFLNPFTATLGQEYWRQTIEPVNVEEERHRDALKIQVSLYDCQKYMDGTLSPWTNEKINRAIANCPTAAEVQRRIYGRFVKTEGLMVPSFSHEKNLKPPEPIPKDWLIFGAIDPGTGGEKGHPTGIVFVAVNPDYTRGRVFRGWRGDGVVTDQQANLNKFRELRRGLTMSLQIYDYHAKEFFLIASQQGENFIQANKARDFGYGVLNTLFKNGMLTIDSGDPELTKLVTEICTLSVGKDKREAKDDMLDALRYVVAGIPWDFSSIELPAELKEIAAVQKPRTSSEDRKDFFAGQGEYKKADNNEIDEEIDMWNELYG